MSQQLQSAGQSYNLNHDFTTHGKRILVVEEAQVSEKFCQHDRPSPLSRAWERGARGGEGSTKAEYSLRTICSGGRYFEPGG